MLAKRIDQAARLTGQFTLRSGAVSDTYFDKYRFEANPQLLMDICRELAPLVPSDTEVLGGLELGGIPIATLVSQLTGVPAAFIRKEAKTYGTCRYAEGADIEGKRVCLVEDVVSSGGAILDFARRLRGDGALINTAVCVIDRESGGTEALKEHAIELRALLTMTDINSSTG